MKALVFRDIQQLEYTDIPDAEIEHPADAIVQVQQCGVCGSDLHIYEGRETGIDSGTVFGHELVGEVVARGSDVAQIQNGDRVAAPFTTNCGDCFQCDAGLTARCLNGQLLGWREGGQGLHGSHSEFVRIPFADATLLRLPDQVGNDVGVLLGDNLSTAFFCVEQAAMRLDTLQVVLGCGTVGSLVVLAAKRRGAEQLLAVDGVLSRRERALSMGADYACSPEEAAEVVANLTGGRGAGSVMEAVGSGAAQRLAFELVQAGGTISTVGVHTDPHFSFAPAEAYGKNLTFKIGRCPARHFMDEVLPWVGELNLKDIVTHEMPLSAGVEAYRMFADRAEGVGKILLAP